MTKPKMEFRFGKLEARATEEGKLHVEGYAAVFNQRALIWESDWSGYKYFEQIDPGAFDGADMSDVVMRYNHDDGAMVLARTKNGTLRLTTDEHGLKVDADIAPTSCGKDVYVLIQRGDITQMSFAFTVAEEEVETQYDIKEQTRTIKRFGLIHDVAPVDFPAYDGTEIQARAADSAHIREEELRKKLICLTMC